MTYRDIVVLVDDKAESTALIAAALHQGGSSQALVIGAFIKPPFIYPYAGAEFGAYLPGDVIQSLMDDHAAQVLAASQKAKSLFQTKAEQSGVKFEWHELDGADNSALVALARCTDLLVYPKGGLPGPGFSTADITLAVGGPVLLAPRITSDITPTLALLAWNGSREAANALRGSWPILSSLANLHVISVGTHQGSMSVLEQHIKRHGLTAQINLQDGRDADAGEILQKEAKALGANLVVMGLYGRTRLQEFILGGVSRAMLHAADPTLLLVAH